MTGPTIPECDVVHSEKYRSEKEDYRECMNRIASTLQDSHDHYMKFRQIILDMRFLPAGRVQAATGSLKNITSSNCYVMPEFHDSFTDGPDEDEPYQGSYPPLSIMDVNKVAAQTMRQGGGVGFDISPLRPKMDVIHGVQSVTDGPMAFLPISDAICRATSSAGNRRGAMMVAMRCDHPDIEAFIHAKHAAQDVPYEYRPLRGFNMSIAITDEFMEAVMLKKSFPLRFGGKVYREIDAVSLWEIIMRSTYDWAEPGVIFIDTVNRMNNLYYCETIATTNPCGEQPLPPYGACLLGSFNLAKYLWKDGGGGYHFSWQQLKEDIPHVVRSMDNIINRARYPVDEQRQEAESKRRMGLGVTGLANCIEALGYPYGSKQFIETEDEILAFITRRCYLASIELAREKGPFHLYNEKLYHKSQFIQSLDEDVIDKIKRYGIRNSHLTSIAPTGTISFCADNVSSGIEPVFGYAQERRIIMPEGPTVVSIPDYGVNKLNRKGKRAMDVTAQEHVDVLITAQKHIDSAVSKTCNVPTDFPYSEFKELYMKAYQGGAKGCTTYRPNGNYDEVIKSTDNDAACGFDPETGQRVGECTE